MQNIMLAKPIYQLASLCLTIAYKPSWPLDNSEMYTEIETVVVPGFDIEAFISEANNHFIFGLEECPFESHEDFLTEAPAVLQYLRCWSDRLCPQIISALYVDEMGAVSIVAEGLEVDTSSQWEFMGDVL